MAKRKSANNKFSNASDIERALAKKLATQLGCEFVGTPYKCGYDAVFAKDGLVSVVECKVRTFESDRYDTSIIEKKKYDDLMTYLDGRLCQKILYVMFFTDDVAIVWNLEKTDVNWTTDPFVKTTMGDRSKVDKLVSYLPNDKGTKIQLN